MIRDNAPGNPQSVALAGTGTAPLAAVEPPGVSFVDQRVGTNSPGHLLTLSNPGSAPLEISGVKVTGPHAADFPLQNHCGTQLAAGKSCSMVVLFKPHAAGSRTATLKITTDAAGSPPAEALTGTGIAPVALVIPAAIIN